MKIKFGNRQTMLALGVLAIGIMLGCFIVFPLAKKPAGTAAQETQISAAVSNTVRQTAQHADRISLSAAQMLAAGISVQTAAPAAITGVLTMPGEIRFNDDRTAHVVPRLAGIVEVVRADLGQNVRKGQVLAVISSIALSEQRSEFLTAQKKLALAKTTFEREKKLWEDKVSAEQDYLQARHAMQEAEIAQQNAQQKLRALGAAIQGAGTLNTYELRAPFDGVIVEKHIAQGEAVKEDANIFTISDLSTVWADIAVPARSLDTVRLGAKAVIKADSSEMRANGTITYVGSLVGEQTRTAQARVVLANPQSSWRPGLFVTVDVASTAFKAAVAVLSEAIQTVAGKPTVFVRVNGGFEARTVLPGKTDGKMTEIRDGLKAGSQYAAQGSFVLKAELGKASAEDAH